VNPLPVDAAAGALLTRRTTDAAGRRREAVESLAILLCGLLRAPKKKGLVTWFVAEGGG
jgi:hypothetical protein